MKLLTLEIIATIAALLLGFLTLGIKFRDKEKLQKKVSLVAILVTIAASLYLVSSTDKDLPDTINLWIACKAFPDGAACKSKQARNSDQPAITTVVEQDESIPLGPKPSASDDLALFDFGEWWPQGMPVPSSADLLSEENLWQAIRSTRYACEPLRRYVGMYGNGAHIELAKRKLHSKVDAQEKVSGVLRETGKSEIFVRLIDKNLVEERDGRTFCKAHYEELLSAFDSSYLKGQATGICTGAALRLSFTGYEVLSKKDYVYTADNSCSCKFASDAKQECQFTATPTCDLSVKKIFSLERCNN